MPKIKHYKQSRYKAHRKPVNKRLIFVIVSTVIIIAASIGLGAYLNRISAPDIDSDNTDIPQTQTSYGIDYSKLEVSSVSAAPLPDAAYESDAEAESAILRANGAMQSSLTVRLLNNSGAPRYKSDIYSRIYSAEAKGIDLSAFTEKAKKSGLSISAIFPLLSQQEENSDISAARESFELQLIAEVYSQGIREIVLTGIGTPVPDRLFSFMQKLKSLCPELAVGISLKAEAAAADAILCATLADIFDFLVLDHTQAFEETVAAYAPNIKAEDTVVKEDSAKDTTEAETDTGTDTSEEAPKPPESPLYLSIDSTFFVVERFGARAFIDIGDGCDHCRKTASEALNELKVESYMLTCSSADHAVLEQETVQ